MPSLLLHARDPEWAPADISNLVQVLKDLGLVCNPREASDDNKLLAGERFLDLVMFLGCSPKVELDPVSAPHGAEVCHIAVNAYPQVIFVAADKRAPARCPACRAVAGDVVVADVHSVHECSECAWLGDICQLDWRRSAGFGRCFIEVCGVYPHEALPADQLLLALKAYSGGSWDYFYR